MKQLLPTTVLTLSMFTLLLAPALVANAATGDVTVHSGTWAKKSYSASGTWKIVRNGDHHYLELDSRFKTRGAPDLKLFLSKKSASQLSGRNATSGAVRIAKLKSKSGAQRYRLPTNLDLADYRTVIIHCEQYSKLWSTGTLR